VHLAGVDLLAGVHQVVVLEVASKCEGHVAHSTSVRLRGTVTQHVFLHVV
jgi:hypothetical protein